MVAFSLLGDIIEQQVDERAGGTEEMAQRARRTI